MRKDSAVYPAIICNNVVAWTQIIYFKCTSNHTFIYYIRSYGQTYIGVQKCEKAPHYITRNCNTCIGRNIWSLYSQEIKWDDLPTPWSVLLSLFILPPMCSCLAKYILISVATMPRIRVQQNQWQCLRVRQEHNGTVQLSPLQYRAAFEHYWRRRTCPHTNTVQ